MEISKIFTRSERTVIAFLLAISIAGIGYSSYKKSHIEKIPFVDFRDAETITRKININTASEDELTRLTGVGPALAARIVEYRSRNGRFTDIGDVANVSGIGPKKLDAIRNRVVLDDDTSLAE